MSENMTQLLEKLAAVTAERDHWKANHDNRVNAAKILMDRTDMPLERVGAYKHYVAALEANQKLRERAEKAEAELAKLREQKPVAYLDYWKSDGTGIVRKQRTTGVPFFNHPLPAPAVPTPTPFIPDDDTRRNDEAFAAQQAAQSVPMQRNIPGDRCEICGAVEVAAMSPRTKYACGSSDYDKRPGTFKQGDNCRALLQSAEVNHD